MRPVLKALEDGRERRSSEVATDVADALHLPPADREARLKTGQSILINRVAWAILYLVKADAVERPRYGHVRLLPRGRQLLASKEEIRTKTLEQFAEFSAWRNFEEIVTPSAGGAPRPSVSVSPQEEIERGAATLEKLLQEDLLKRLGESDPAFFERVVVDLLRAMGYAERGGTMQLGQTGDGGVDGVLFQDALALEPVFVQAKQYSGSVGAPDVNNFIGALNRKKTAKGVLMTTGTFSKPALNAVLESSSRIALVDGARLAELMVEHGVGVTTTATYKIQRIDLDYFDPDQ